ncbi:MAG TPA: thiamine biosynthesis protein ThiJ [Bacteroidetes bacterium]|nr:thiamine biosynthesis protein ThiJ [Bacteroidota bacterium]
MKKIIIPLPDKDFDLTEVAVPWKMFKDKGYKITFATEKGKVAQTDPMLITGVIFGQLGAKKEAIEIYRELEKAPEFLNPITYAEIDVADFDAMHLPGGHAKGVKQYLESEVLQEKVAQFFEHNKIVGSICHGALVLARAKDKKTGKSVVHNKKMTALIKILEKAAYYITAWKLGDYYRTYPEYTQDEVKNVLDDKKQFVVGNPFVPMVVEDGNLVTARWPEDAVLYAEKLIEKLEN